jgi:mannose-6-phosphate isomerase-like protein (cupin superfamily)
MSNTPTGYPAKFSVTLAEAIAAPLPEGRRSAELFRNGSMHLRYYAPAASGLTHDPQAPHDQDEVYIVASGTGTFLCGEKRVAFGPGDALFVPANVVHRFEDFSPDFATWVVFYGPTGGEVAEGRN